MPIPVIAGLAPHPNQLNNPVAKPAEMAAGQSGASVGAVRRSSLMSDQSRNVLRTIAGTLRKVGGLPEPEPDPATAKPRAPERRADPAAQPTAGEPGRGQTAAAAGAAPPLRRQ